MNNKNSRLQMKLKFFSLMLALIMGVHGCTYIDVSPGSSIENSAGINISNVPEYSGKPYIEINNNIPEFDKGDLSKQSFEEYGELDYLGRCTQAYANIGVDIMPTEKRGEISHIKPTGWQSAKYDVVDGKYLYNRCHLIGFQLTGENANKQNLITGTRYMNVDGMLPFENDVAEYVENTQNHVLYRVTPIYNGTNLVAEGVQMEALSIEDEGKGICFNVYVYNVQPGISINYATGDSEISNNNVLNQEQTSKEAFIINKKSKKFHSESCSSVSDIKKENKKEYYGSYEDLIEEGYVPCGRCIKE